MSAISFNSWLLGRDKPLATVKPARDVRIDVIRGVALMMIFINHMPGNMASALTLANFVFNDAAEVFVLLAGYSSMMAYHRGFDGGSFAAAARPILARARTLYAVQMALSIAMLLLGLWLVQVTGNRSFIDHLEIAGLLDAPVTALLAAPLLLFQVSYADILPLYVVLLAVAPLLIVAVRRSPVLTLAGSSALYVVALRTGLNLPQVFGGEWFFNPFAWQLIFVIGLVAGHATLAGITLPRHPALIAVAVVVVAFVVSQKAPWRAFGIDASFAVALPFDLNYGAKSYVAPGRLISLLAIVYLAAVLLPREAGWLRGGMGTLLSEAGRHSLPVFTMGAVLSLLGFGALAVAGNEPAVAAAVTVVGIGAMLTLAHALDRKPRQLAYAGRTATLPRS